MKHVLQIRNYFTVFKTVETDTYIIIKRRKEYFDEVLTVKQMIEINEDPNERKVMNSIN